jgi:F-type H+-transporting ATPase subunit alpha
VEIQVAVLWSVQNNFVDDVPVEKIKDYQAKLTEFLFTRKAELLKKIRAEKAISDALTGELKTAITEFKQTYDIGKPKEAEEKPKAASPEKAKVA